MMHTKSTTYLYFIEPSAWSGGPGPGVGARCGNGLFSTYKSPKFYLSFTILVSLILVKYPDRIGLVNTEVGTSWYRYRGTVPYSLALFYPGI